MADEFIPTPLPIHKLIQPIPTDVQELRDLVLCAKVSTDVMVDGRTQVSKNINEVTCATCKHLWINEEFYS